MPLVTAIGNVVELADTVPTEVQIMPIGEWSGRKGDGPFRLDRADADAMARASMEGNERLVIDYEHQTEFSKENGKAAPAAGWITGFKVKDGGVWANVEWTSSASAAIGAKEYRYISPTFQYQRRDGRIARIVRAGLTNTPNFEMAAIASAVTPETEMDELLKALAAALGLPDGTDKETAIASVKDLVTVNQKQEAALTAAASAAGVKLDLEKPEALTTTIASAIAAAGTAGGDVVPMADYRKLSTDFAALRDAVANDKAGDAVDSAIADGRLVPAQRDWALGYASQDLSGFKDFVGKQPKVVSSKPRPETGPDDLEIDPEELAIASQMGVSADDFKKTRAGELNKGT